MVAMGCYCGAQPMNGVGRKYATTAQSCQDVAASACALGCPSETGQVAQDGNKPDATTRIVVRCDHATCKSYVSSAPSGEPPSGW